MLKRTIWLVAVAAAMLAWPSARVDAAMIVPRPDQILFGLPGATVGWGYEITTDADRDLVFTSINADVFAGSGSVSVGVFDFPFVPAGTSVQLDYARLPGLGLVELTLSPLLSPGARVTARVFGDYVLQGPTGGLPDLPQSFELFVTAQAAQSAAVVPEPATLLLLGTGLLAVARRCYRASRLPGRRPADTAPPSAPRHRWRPVRG